MSILESYMSFLIDKLYIKGNTSVTNTKLITVSPASLFGMALMMENNHNKNHSGMTFSEVLRGS